MDRLEEIIARQLDLQLNHFKAIGAGSTYEERMQYLKDNLIALEHELHEALDETNWKPWTTREGFMDTEPYIGELIDALHFLLNLFIVTAPELSAADFATLIYTRYMAKAQVNEERQAAGYDGLNKCPNCRRSYDDSSTRCLPHPPMMWPTLEGQEDLPWCQDAKGTNLGGLVNVPGR